MQKRDGGKKVTSRAVRTQSRPTQLTVLFWKTCRGHGAERCGSEREIPEDNSNVIVAISNMEVRLE
jgi:hypothetical protein